LKRTPLPEFADFRSPESEWTEVIAISVAHAQPNVRAKAFTERELHNPLGQEDDVDSRVIGVRILPFVKRRERAGRKQKSPRAPIEST
jgi:hypothetical protein